jgi:D-glycero-beta-D-manno-heptose 1-phosphate adenylyltransferase
LRTNKNCNSKVKVGDRHHRLLVKEYLGSFLGPGTRGNYPLFLCICDCGNEKKVFSYDLTRKHVKSCGCLGKEILLKAQDATRERNNLAFAKGSAAQNSIFNWYVQNAKKRGLEFNISREEFLESIKKKCSYCGCEPSQLYIKNSHRIVYNGLDRIDSNKGYISNNITTCCSQCNIAKGSLDILTFEAKSRRIAKRIDRKIDIKELTNIVNFYKEKDFKITVVSGVFDLYHSGHSNYIKYASQFGDLLIIGINDDKSVTALKGPTRPINNEQSRLEVISSLSCVDHCCIYSDTTEFLKLVKPDFWIKGCEYSLETLNQQERKVVEEGGGKIVFAPREFEISTTKILEKLNVQV